MTNSLIPVLITRPFITLFLVVITASVSATEATPADTTILKNPACMQCHEKLNSALIKDWQSSAHATASPVVNCVSCHGQLHKNIASVARPDKACIDCHGGRKNPVAHSYSSSKHGTLMRIEKNTYDWNQPFKLANYRTPGCGYCHMHNNNHNVSVTVRHVLMNDTDVEKIHDNTRAVCQDCHSPRYITDLLSNGEAMLEISRKKVREANEQIKQAEKTFSNDELLPARKQFEKMQHHLNNVYLGVGHQSPDYQWWHGQPALDGDLLRIKDGISELYRLKK